MKEGDNSSPIDEKLLHEELYVYDIVYNRKTKLVQDAENKLGEERIADGRGMLAAQGAFSFSLWTGVAPSKVVKIMREALDRAIE